MSEPFFTIGHSTRALDEFLELLRDSGVELIVDVRKLPGSTRYPQFDQDALDELIISVREFGVLQPIVVRPLPDWPVMMKPPLGSMPTGASSRAPRPRTTWPRHGTSVTRPRPTSWAPTMRGYARSGWPADETGQPTSNRPPPSPTRSVRPSTLSWPAAVSPDLLR